MKIIVEAEVRQVGAIGVFYPQTFTLENSTPETFKDDWFREHGAKWELHHFINHRVDTGGAPAPGPGSQGWHENFELESRKHLSRF